ncbi:uncharacterized protein B0P05DRAFT_639369 [Gilbertella persicaria]|uniref:uncharacterized protein n=1 Tax=Gilbertella persicaria TaxID=101096 RepID=UPI00221EC746|nr:uncharacterized protein B0P05DRAFT_639369 [Gilbertella persicaria]KAI8069833.1 hypothetical protein B0P05DRAFT_639369 [Gilbertella persicaria]
MRITLLTAFTAFLFSLAVAQSSSAPFYITNPIEGTVFKGGSSASIQWSNGLDQIAKVSLLTGTNAFTMQSTGITFNINGSLEEYTWKVPKDLPQGATFAIKIDYTKDGTVGSTYSSPFLITNTTGAIVTESFVSTKSSIVSSSLPSSTIGYVSLTTVVLNPASSIASVSSISNANISSASFSSTAASLSITTVLPPSTTKSIFLPSSATAFATTTPQIPNNGSKKLPAAYIFALMSLILVYLH